MTDAPAVCEVVITAPDVAWMQRFAHDLITMRLVAAAHLFTPITSIYRWDDIVHEEREVRAAFHTRRSLVAPILDQVRDRHPFQVPGVVVQPITDGGSDYLDWIYRETRDDRAIGAGRPIESRPDTVSRPHLPPETFGGRVAFYRKRRGLSQVALGQILDRTEGWVSQVERGDRAVDRLSVLRSLADALGVSLTDLLPDVTA
jgi:periplasmic divalent cation tolerance protein